MNSGPADARERYEHALEEVEEMKRMLRTRAKHVAELEQRLMRQAERAEGGRPLPPVDAPVESDLSRAIAEADAEKALAQAEREQLDQRERAIRKVERELAGLRVKLEQERASLAATPPRPERKPKTEPEPAADPPPPTPLPTPEPEPELTPAAKRPATRRRTTTTKRQAS